MKKILSAFLAFSMLLTIGCVLTNNPDPFGTGGSWSIATEDSPILIVDENGDPVEGSTAPEPKESEPETTPRQRTLAVKEMWYGDPETGKLKERLEYDTEGRIVKREYYAIDYLSESEIREYDADGICTRTLITELNRDGTVRRTKETVRKGNETFTYVNGEIDSWDERIRDDAGRLTQVIYHTSDIRFEYEYNAKGERIKALEYWHGRFDEETHYEYDHQGNCIAETTYRADGTMDSGIKKEYDDDNNCIRVWKWNRETGDYSIDREYEYDDKGVRVLEARWNADANAYNYQVYSIDDSFSVRAELGLITEITKRNSNGSIAEIRQETTREGIVLLWEFSYDEEGRFTAVQQPNGYNTMDRTVFYNYITYVNRYR